MSQDTRTISLTGRSPICIKNELWPVIASASEHDNQYEFQANRKAWIKVRRHADGRAIVYGCYDTAFQNEHNISAGVYLDSPETTDEEIISAIREVAEEIGTWGERLARQCIQDMPAATVD